MTNQSTGIKKVSDPPFLWLGEHRALDFVNTEPLVRGQPVELLDRFERLVAWCETAGLLPGAQAEAALARWTGSREAARALELAHALRSELRHALEQRAGAGRRHAPSLDALNACLRVNCAKTMVSAVAKGRFERRVRLSLGGPDELLRPIADAAVELLCDLDPELVRRCDNPQCVLYFHDVSKNHARRWCSMSLCGNRIKVAAHEARQRARLQRNSKQRKSR